MPHKKPEELNAGKWDMIPDWQAETWGDLEVCYTTTPEAATTAIEFNPAGQLKFLMDGINQLMKDRIAAGLPPVPEA